MSLSPNESAAAVPRYDALIVGTGPAGLLAAYDLLRERPGTSVVLLDAGRALDERQARAGSELEGYGGAGLYIGGRLYVGRYTIPVMPPGTPPAGMVPVLAGADYERRARAVDDFFAGLGARSELIATPPPQLAESAARAAEVGIEYVTSYPARPLGVEERQGILAHLRDYLEHAGATLLFRQPVVSVERRAGEFEVVTGGDRKGAESAPARYRARTVLLAPGRYGAEWLARVVSDVGARLVSLPTAFGVRLELAASSYAALTDVTPDPRLHRELENDALLKTYATCPGGLVVAVRRYGSLVASGVPLPRDRRSANTTFAVLVQPGVVGAAGPWRGGEEAAHMLNARAPGALVVQRLADVRAGRATAAAALAANAVRPTCADAVPGLLHDAYPAPYWTAVEDFLGRIDRLAPGATGDETLVYGPAEERFWYFPTDEHLQTTVPGLFVAGDAAGQSQGIIQASVSGMLAAEGMRRRLGG